MFDVFIHSYVVYIKLSGNSISKLEIFFGCWPFMGTKMTTDAFIYVE
jgi:hypothetical protein